MKTKLIVNNDEVRARAVNMINALDIDDPHEVIIKKHKADRSLEQNAKLHAMLSDVSKQVTWQGMSFSIVVWKRLVMASYLREIGETPMLIPSLDNNGIDIIFEKTSKMGIKKMAGLIEWVYAFGSESSVVWSEKSKRVE